MNGEDHCLFDLPWSISILMVVHRDISKVEGYIVSQSIVILLITSEVFMTWLHHHSRQDNDDGGHQQK
jgi:hypothetical protein